MTQDEQHLDILSKFHYIVGGLTAVFSCIPVMHIAMGIGMLHGSFMEGPNAPPRMFAWFFIVLGSIFIVSGWALAGFMVSAGRKLKRQQSHTFCVVVAGFECLLMPFGTVLGVFTLVVLMKEAVQKLFSENKTIETTP